MKVIFLDIETVPTDQALREHGLLEPQLQLNEGDLIKKLSLSATTAKILCLCYAMEPAVHTAIEVLDGDEGKLSGDSGALPKIAICSSGITFSISICVSFTSARSFTR